MCGQTRASPLHLSRPTSRSDAKSGDTGRYGEIWGDMGGCGEMWGDMDLALRRELGAVGLDAPPEAPRLRLLVNLRHTCPGRVVDASAGGPIAAPSRVHLPLALRLRRLDRRLRLGGGEAERHHVLDEGSLVSQSSAEFTRDWASALPCATTRAAWLALRAVAVGGGRELGGESDDGGGGGESDGRAPLLMRRVMSAAERRESSVGVSKGRSSLPPIRRRV